MTQWPRPEDVHTLVFDFDGVFTDNKVYVSADGVETVRCDRADGLGIDFLRKFIADTQLPIHFFILSTERNPVVSARAKKLGLDCQQGVGDKLAFLKAYMTERHSDKRDPYAGLVYLGNDLNDLPAMEIAGFSVAPNDAHPQIKEKASTVLPNNGGDGFVRAFVERFIGLTQLTEKL